MRTSDAVAVRGLQFSDKAVEMASGKLPKRRFHAGGETGDLAVDVGVEIQVRTREEAIMSVGIAPRLGLFYIVFLGQGCQKLISDLKSWRTSFII